MEQKNPPKQFLLRRKTDKEKILPYPTLTSHQVKAWAVECGIVFGAKETPVPFGSTWKTNP